MRLLNRNPALVLRVEANLSNRPPRPGFGQGDHLAEVVTAPPYEQYNPSGGFLGFGISFVEQPAGGTQL